MKAWHRAQVWSHNHPMRTPRWSKRILTLIIFRLHSKVHIREISIHVLHRTHLIGMTICRMKVLYVNTKMNSPGRRVIIIKTRFKARWRFKTSFSMLCLTEFTQKLMTTTCTNSTKIQFLYDRKIWFRHWKNWGMECRQKPI